MKTDGKSQKADLMLGETIDDVARQRQRDATRYRQLSRTTHNGITSPERHFRRLRLPHISPRSESAQQLVQRLFLFSHRIVITNRVQLFTFRRQLR
jgi:hypothetical protein